jgi:hypothetical protein
LGHLAYQADNSLGRRYNEYDEKWLDGIVGPFVIDAKIVDESKAVRRQRRKTQVFTGTVNSHMRDRDVHAREVISNAVIMASILGLNPEMCRVGAIAHDCCHLPGGHPAERILSRLSGRKIKHNRLFCVIGQHVERKGQGLPLLFETYEIVLFHSADEHIRPVKILPKEYFLLAFADTAAFITADPEDAVKRMRFISPADFPPEFWVMGNTQRERQRYIVSRLVKESARDGRVSFTDEAFEVTKRWMYEHLYYPANSIAFADALERTYAFVATSTIFEGCDPVLVIALMIDDDVMHLDRILQLGRGPEIRDFEDRGFWELVPGIRGREIDLENPDLDWGLERWQNRNRE